MKTAAFLVWMAVNSHGVGIDARLPTFYKEKDKPPITTVDECVDSAARLNAGNVDNDPALVYHRMYFCLRVVLPD